jgi:hypothetical protein
MLHHLRKNEMVFSKTYEMVIGHSHIKLDTFCLQEGPQYGISSEGVGFYLPRSNFIIFSEKHKSAAALNFFSHIVKLQKK